MRRGLVRAFEALHESVDTRVIVLTGAGANRAATADEDAALPFGQAEESGFVGDADVRGRRELQPSADHRAMQRSDERDRAPRDDVEHLMPGMALALARELRLTGRAGQRFTQVEASAEMLAVAMQHADIGLVSVSPRASRLVTNRLAGGAEAERLERAFDEL